MNNFWVFGSFGFTVLSGSLRETFISGNTISLMGSSSWSNKCSPSVATTRPQNAALCCHKGQTISSIAPASNRLILLYSH